MPRPVSPVATERDGRMAEAGSRAGASLAGLGEERSPRGSRRGSQERGMSAVKVCGRGRESKRWGECKWCVGGGQKKGHLGVRGGAG